MTIANQGVVAELHRIQQRVNYITREYEETGLPDNVIDFNLRQAIHSLRHIQQQLKVG